MANEGLQRYVVNNKSIIVRHGFGELGVLNRKPPDLSQKLDFKEGHGRYTPGTMPVQPNKFRKPLGLEDKPNQKAGIE
jgi:hypothetical protein